MFSVSNLRRNLYRASFYDFVVDCWPSIIHDPPVLNWHIKYICDHMQEVAERAFRGERREYDYYIINIPPGSSKSTIVSQMFPAWVWGRMPYAQFITASYSNDVAKKDSVRMRDILEYGKYQAAFPEVKIRDDIDAKGMFQNTSKGWRMSISMGSSPTGFHAHFIIVDDPMNPKGATSDVERVNANDFMEQTLPTRQVDKEVTPTFLVMQRLHMDDPSGRLLETHKEGCHLLCLPGELTDDIHPKELAVNYKDNLLDPVRLSNNVLNGYRGRLGDYGYAGQILQRPVPLDGGIFKVQLMASYDGVLPPMKRVVRAWDKAGSSGKGDYTSGVKMGLDVKGRFWVLDVVRGQWSAWEREQIIKATAKKDDSETGNVEIILEQEGGSGGKESAESTVRNLAGHRVTLVTRSKGVGDKETRSYPFSSQVGGGNVSYLRGEWNIAYLRELGVFPNGVYDDQVDASSTAFNHMAKSKIRIGAL